MSSRYHYLIRGWVYRPFYQSRISAPGRLRTKSPLKSTLDSVLLSGPNRPSTYEAVFIPLRPRLCENAKSKNPSGKLRPIYCILRLENGFQWSVQVLTRPVMQRYPICEKFKIVFTQPRPISELASICSRLPKPAIAMFSLVRNTLAGIQFRVNLRDTHSSIESRTASGVSVSGQ